MNIYTVILNYPDKIYVSNHTTHEGAMDTAMAEIDELSNKSKYDSFEDPGDEDPNVRLEAWNAYQANSMDPYLITVVDTLLFHD